MKIPFSATSIKLSGLDFIKILLSCFLIIIFSRSKTSAQNTISNSYLFHVIHKIDNPPKSIVEVGYTLTVHKNGSIHLYNDLIDRSNLINTIVNSPQMRPYATRIIFLRIDGDCSIEIVNDTIELIKSASIKLRKNNILDKYSLGLDGGGIQVIISVVQNHEKPTPVILFI